MGSFGLEALAVMSDHRKTVVARGYDLLGDDYLAWASAFADPGRDRLLDEFTRRLPSGARVLDLGCGPGVPSTRLLADRFDVIGVDISETQLDAARRNVPQASFVHGDLADVDFPPESFDGVAALYSMSHVPREEHGPLFERVSRWLVQGDPSGCARSARRPRLDRRLAGSTDVLQQSRRGRKPPIADGGQLRSTHRRRHVRRRNQRDRCRFFGFLPSVAREDPRLSLEVVGPDGALVAREGSAVVGRCPVGSTGYDFVELGQSRS